LTTEQVFAIFYIVFSTIFVPLICLLTYEQETRASFSGSFLWAKSECVQYYENNVLGDTVDMLF